MSRHRSIVVAAVVLGVAAVVLGGCAHSNGASPVTPPGVQVAAPSPPPARPLAIQDVMPDFWQWRRAVEGQSVEAQADAFMADFAPRFPHIYNEQVVGGLFAGTDAARASLVKYFTELPAHEEAIRSASATLPRELARAGTLIQQAFPGAALDTPVVVAPSLFSFDGATRVVDGKSYLYFAPDGMVRWHEPGDDACVFFAHELFHVVHAEHLPESEAREPLWVSMWREGLATHVSGELCGVRDEGVLLLQRALPAESRAAWTRLVPEIEAALDTTDEPTYWSYFGGRAPEGLPKRSAYFVGLHVARRIATQKPLRDLPRLSASQLSPLVREALRSIRDAVPTPNVANHEVR